MPKTSKIAPSKHTYFTQCCIDMEANLLLCVDFIFNYSKIHFPLYLLPIGNKPYSGRSYKRCTIVNNDSNVIVTRILLKL